MSIRYVHDLYPRTDPRDGARVRRFTSLQEASAIIQRNGTGSGAIAVRSTTDDGLVIDPLGLQYVRVRRINTAIADGATLSGFDEKVIHGYYFEEGDFLALDRKRKRLLTFGGAGTLSYLDRAAMAPHTYMDTFEAQDPFDDIWRLHAQSTVFAGWSFLGAMLWRAVYEAQHFRVALTPHRHADGETYTDSHDDDRTATAIPDVVLTFDGFTDTDGNAWTVPAGEFTAQVGESLLSVV